VLCVVAGAEAAVEVLLLLLELLPHPASSPATAAAAPSARGRLTCGLLLLGSMLLQTLRRRGTEKLPARQLVLAAFVQRYGHLPSLAHFAQG